MKDTTLNTFVIGILALLPATLFAQATDQTIRASYALTATFDGELVKRQETSDVGFHQFGDYSGVQTTSSSAGYYYNYDNVSPYYAEMLNRPFGTAYGLHNADDIGQVASSASFDIFQDHLYGFRLSAPSRLTLRYHDAGAYTAYGTGSALALANFQSAASLRDTDGNVYFESARAVLASEEFSATPRIYCVRLG